MLTLGDSITHGYDAHHTNLSYANLTADLLDMDLLNQGVGGDVFSAPKIWIRSCPIGRMLSRWPTVRMNWAGGRLIPAGEAARYLEKLVKLLPEGPDLLLLPLHRNGETEPRNGYTLADCRDYLRKIAEALRDCDGG